LAQVLSTIASLSTCIIIIITAIIVVDHHHHLRPRRIRGHFASCHLFLGFPFAIMVIASSSA